MSQFITTHDNNGNAVFSTKVPEQQHFQEIPGGKLSFIYTSHADQPDLSTEADIDQYAHDREHGLPNHAICPTNGFAAAMVHFPPNSTSLTHRTMSLDVQVVIEGVVELHLENSEKRTLRAGDVATQRGTLHHWVNVTPNDGWAKCFAIATPIASPLEVGGKTLETEWRM